MIDYKKSLIGPDATIDETMATIEQSDSKIAIVIDADQKLIGTITDGDIRRGIISGLKITDNIEPIIFRTPTTCHINQAGDTGMLLDLMRDKQIQQIPIIDNDGRIVGLQIRQKLHKKKPNAVVIMAGGQGQRLRPLTEETPKPMLEIGGKPILENQINMFKDAGFNRFCLSVNYKADVIKDYFGNGENHDVEISYLEESQPLQTAGALSLLPEKPSAPFIVINGDILTKVDFSNVLDFHAAQNAFATMCAREHTIEIPYGVINADEFEFQSVDEKPSVSYFVNAGIYVFDPDVIDYIPKNEPLNMTDLFKSLKEAHKMCCTYPLHEYWLDIGKKEDFERAQEEYKTVFK